MENCSLLLTDLDADRAGVNPLAVNHDEPVPGPFYPLPFTSSTRLQDAFEPLILTPHNTAKTSRRVYGFNLTS